MSETGHKSYHERAANGNSHIVVLIKNFHFVLITEYLQVEFSVIYSPYLMSNL